MIIHCDECGYSSTSSDTINELYLQFIEDGGRVEKEGEDSVKLFCPNGHQAQID